MEEKKCECYRIGELAGQNYCMAESCMYRIIETGKVLPSCKENGDKKRPLEIEVESEKVLE